jgi:S1-C subfamily serine protease
LLAEFLLVLGLPSNIGAVHLADARGHPLRRPRDPDGTQEGSGFVIDSQEELIVSAAHVVQDINGPVGVAFRIPTTVTAPPC